MGRTWNIAEAKSEFSSLIHSAQTEAQIIKNRNQEVVVVLPINEYHRLQDIQNKNDSNNRWANFVEYSKKITKKNNLGINLPSREHTPSVFENWDK